MYCPGCGIQPSTDQNYCRVCGLNLEAVSGVVSSDGIELARKHHEKLVVRRMVRLMSAGGMVLLVGLVLLIVDRKLIHDSAVGLAATLTMLLGLFIMAFGLFSSISHASNRAADRHNVGAGGKLATAETRRLSSGDQSVLPVDSVIDKSTELLNVEATTRKPDTAEM